MDDEHTEKTPVDTSNYIDDDRRMPTISQLLVSLGILGIVLMSPEIAHLIEKRSQPTASVEEYVTPLHQEESIRLSTNIFEGIYLEAEAAYVWDVADEKPLYSKNAHAQLPLASLTKLMTGLVVFEDYRGDDTKIPITLEAIRQDGESGFQEGEEWSLRSLLEYMLITSSNDGAYALAGSVGSALKSETSSDETPEQLFIDRMNQKATELGLRQTFFTNPTGLDETEMESGSYGSARDMAFLMQYIVQNAPSIVTPTTHKKTDFSNASGSVYTAHNTNPAVVSLRNPLGSKTGYTDLAGGNLVVAFNIGLNRPIIVSVLGSTREGRFRDVTALVERITNHYQSKQP